MGEATEEQLFDRFRRKGDLWALGQVFDRTAPALLRVAVHVAKDPATSEDLVQVTFLAAIESAADYRIGRPLLPDRHPASPGGAAPLAGWPSAGPGAGAGSDFPGFRSAGEGRGTGTERGVDAAIATLPEQYRAVLRLRLGYGHHPAEITHALDRSPGTVRSQLARGLQLLRKNRTGIRIPATAARVSVREGASGRVLGSAAIGTGDTMHVSLEAGGTGPQGQVAAGPGLFPSSRTAAKRFERTRQGAAAVVAHGVPSTLMSEERPQALGSLFSGSLHSNRERSPISSHCDAVSPATADPSR